MHAAAMAKTGKSKQCPILNSQTSEAQIEKWFFDSVRPTSLLKRFLRPEEIGACVAFLAGEKSSAITGAALRADGGVVKSVI
jgi:NAD(P)-dependent dehydrogenase (short-subunit alcohol dehydrogenase family)